MSVSDPVLAEPRSSREESTYTSENVIFFKSKLESKILEETAKNLID